MTTGSPILHPVVRPLPIEALQVHRAGVLQRPFSQAYADSIAAEFDILMMGILAVNRLDDTYRVVDGQHRLAALRQQPPATRGTTVYCQVYEGLSGPEMADLFLGLNGSRTVSAFDRFMVAVTAGHPLESRIMRIVLSAQLEISRRRCRGCICAVGGLQQVFERDGAAVLERVLRTLRDAYDASPDAFGRLMLEGVALVVRVYGPQLDHDSLIAALGRGRHGVRGLQRRAQEYRERLGRGLRECVAAAIVDVYNKKRKRKARVKRWWKV